MNSRDPYRTLAVILDGVAHRLSVEAPTVLLSDTNTCSTVSHSNDTSSSKGATPGVRQEVAS